MAVLVNPQLSIITEHRGGYNFLNLWMRSAGPSSIWLVLCWQLSGLQSGCVDTSYFKKNKKN